MTSPNQNAIWNSDSEYGRSRIGWAVLPLRMSDVPRQRRTTSKTKTAATAMKSRNQKRGTASRAKLVTVVRTGNWSSAPTLMLTGLP